MPASFPAYKNPGQGKKAGCIAYEVPFDPTPMPDHARALIRARRLEQWRALERDRSEVERLRVDGAALRELEDRAGVKPQTPRKLNLRRYQDLRKRAADRAQMQRWLGARGAVFEQPCSR
jgi:hypothetical protein